MLLELLPSDADSKNQLHNLLAIIFSFTCLLVGTKIAFINKMVGEFKEGELETIRNVKYKFRDANRNPDGYRNCTCGSED